MKTTYRIFQLADHPVSQGSTRPDKGSPAKSANNNILFTTGTRLIHPQLELRNPLVKVVVDPLAPPRRIIGGADNPTFQAFQGRLNPGLQ